MPTPTEEDLEALAHKMVNEALAPYASLAPTESLEAIRSRMLIDLLADPEGRLRLRRCFDDPAVDRSKEVERSGPEVDRAEPPDKEQAG